MALAALYPATSFVVVLPLVPLSLDGGRLVFVGVSGALLAWAVTRDDWHHLPLFGGGVYIAAVSLAQWSPLLTAAMLLPGLAWVAAAKPNIGLVVVVAQRSHRAMVTAVLGSAVLLGVSLVVLPGWPGAWRATLAEPTHFNAPITHPGGTLLALALLRWRLPEARVLLALACVPQTTHLYEALPLALVARTSTEALALALLGHLASYGQRWLPSGPSVTWASNVYHLGTLIVWVLYLPSLAMVLRRGNEGPAPAWLERAFTECRVPQWLAGHDSARRG